MTVGSGVVVGSIGVTVDSLAGGAEVGMLVSVVLVTGGGTTAVVGSPVGSDAGGVVSTTVELPVPGKSVSERLIPISEEVGSGAAVVGSCVAVTEGCSVSGAVGEADADGSVGSADAVGATVAVGSTDGEDGSADGDDGSSDVGVVVVGTGAAVSVTFAEGRIALVTSEITLLSIELIGARGSLRVGEGSLVLVTMPVGARRIPVELVGSTDDASEENRSDDVGSADGLATSDEAASEVGVGAADAVGSSASVAVSVGEADSATAGSELVGRTIVAGMPPVEATPADTSLGLSLGAEAKTGAPTELTGVASVEGGTTTVLSTIIVVTPESEPDVESRRPVDPRKLSGVVSAELLASELEMTNVGLSVKVGLSKLASRSLIESLFVVSGVLPKGVDCETGVSVVMLTLLYCRFR